MFDPAAWIYKYYIYPIIYDTSYNLVDTVTWAVILGLAILGLIRLFRRWGLSMDERMVLSTLPYIIASWTPTANATIAHLIGILPMSLTILHIFLRHNLRFLLTERHTK